MTLQQRLEALAQAMAAAVNGKLDKAFNDGGYRILSVQVDELDFYRTNAYDAFTVTSGGPVEAASINLATLDSSSGASIGWRTANGRVRVSQYGPHITGYEFTANPYVNNNVIYHAGNLSFGTGLTYSNGVLTASGGGGGGGTTTFPVTFQADLGVTVSFNGSEELLVTAATVGAVPLGGGTMTGRLTLPASNSERAGLNLGVGSDPLAPVGGDLWVVGAALKYRHGTATRTVMTSDGLQTITAGKIFQGASLTLAASAASLVPFSIPTGTEPTATGNGDIWMTSAGLFYKAGGVTVGPLGSAGGGGGSGWNVVKLAADYVAPNTNTFANVTDGTTTLTFTPPANADWEMTGKIMIETATAANLPRVGVTIGANAANGYGAVNIWGPAATATGAGVGAFGGWRNNTAVVNVQIAAGGLPLPNVPAEVEISMSGRSGASPQPITVQLANETAGTNIGKVLRGSFIRWMVI